MLRGENSIMQIKRKGMKIRAFEGHTLKPELYETFLKKDIQYLRKNGQDTNFNTGNFIRQGLLNQEDEAFMYLYEQDFLNFTTLGLLVELSLKDYQTNLIKKHEMTLKRAHLDHLSIKKDHFGPVIVGYQHQESIDHILHSIRKEVAPFATWSTNDGRQHKLWRISPARHQSIMQCFGGVSNCYILDGHHRFEAAAKYLDYIGEAASDKDYWIQGLAYSTKYVRTFPQHRKLLRTEEINVSKILSQAENIEIKEICHYDQKCQNLELVLLQHGKLYNVKIRQCCPRYGSKLCVEKLEDILAKNLRQMITKQIEYLPGVFFDHQHYLSGGDKNAIFLVKHPDIGKIFDFANSDKVMPPKSTWLEPKPSLHMVVRLPY